MTSLTLRQDREHHIHPWADLAGRGDDEPLVLAGAAGLHVTDEAGRRYLDGMAGMWCVNLGHGHPEMVEAIAAQLRNLDYACPFYQIANPPAAALAARLAALAPGDLSRVFFTTCGSTAADTALRFALYYWRTLGRPERRHILTRAHSYHGSTHLAASVSHDAGEPDTVPVLTEDIHLLPSPDPRDARPGESAEAFSNRILAAMAEAIERIGGERIACFIAEPVQGAGGVIVPPDGYLAGAAALCRQHGILFIADETITAMGRLGHPFASAARFGATPDLLICAKALTSAYIPLGAVLISARLCEDIGRRGIDPVFANGYTFSGHPVACAAALKNLEILERDDLYGRVRRLEPLLQGEARRLAGMPAIRDIRGLGLIVAFELAEPLNAPGHPLTRRVSALCRRQGVLVRAIDNLIVLSPPLVVGEAEIEQMLSAVRHAVAEAA